MKILRYNKFSKKTIIINIFFLIGFFIIIFLIFKKSIDDYDNLKQKINSEYKILKFENAINSKIVSHYYPSKWVGGNYNQYLTFDNGNKYAIFINKNLFESKVYFGELVKQGVIIQKHKDSDTLLLITTDNKEFRFLISDEQ